MHKHKSEREAFYRVVYGELIEDYENRKDVAREEMWAAYTDLIRSCILRDTAKDAGTRAALVHEVTDKVSQVRQAEGSVNFLAKTLDELNRFVLDGFDERISDVREQIWKDAQMPDYTTTEEAAELTAQSPSLRA